MREFIRRPFIIPTVEQPQERRSPKIVVSNVEREAEQSIELVLAKRNTNVSIDFVFRTADVLTEYLFCSRSAYSARTPLLTIGIGHRSRMELVPYPIVALGVGLCASSYGTARNFSPTSSARAKSLLARMLRGPLKFARARIVASPRFINPV